MPPWQPQKGYGDFTEERRLSDAQIQLIPERVAQGSQAGSIPPAPAPNSRRLAVGSARPDPT